MDNQKTILIGTHGKFGEEIIKSAEMIIGKMNHIQIFSLLPSVSAEEYYENIESVLKNLPKRTICLVDLFGGTPANMFTLLSKKYDNIVLSGLNLAMIIEAYENINNMDSDELANSILIAAKDGIKNITECLVKGEKNHD